MRDARVSMRSGEGHAGNTCQCLSQNAIFKGGSAWGASIMIGRTSRYPETSCMNELVTQNVSSPKINRTLGGDSLERRSCKCLSRRLRSRHSHMSGAPVHDKNKTAKAHPKSRYVPPNPKNNARATIRALEEGGKETMGNAPQGCHELGLTRPVRGRNNKNDFIRAAHTCAYHYLPATLPCGLSSLLPPSHLSLSALDDWARRNSF